MNPVWASGRVGHGPALDGVVRAQEPDRAVPAVTVHGALIFALLGRPAKAEREAAAAERASPTGRLSDGSTMEGYLAYLRAILCREGVQEMRRDARTGWDGLTR